MRIHLQSDPADPNFGLTLEAWQQAAAAAGETGHIVTHADTAHGYAEHGTDAVLVAGQSRALAPLRPLLRGSAARLVFTLSAGVDPLAPFDWLPEGAQLVNNRGVHGAKAGGFVAMAVLMLATRMPELLEAQRARSWLPLTTPALRGQHIGIVGTGDLGSAGARALRGLGARVTGIRTRAEPHPDFDATIAVADLDALLPTLAALVLACPLTPATRGLIDARRLALLSPEAGLVNIGRGALLDADALCAALAAGRLRGAVLDVFAPEPPPQDNPVWTAPRLILTPHISCDDPSRYVADSLAILFANLRAWRNGETPPNLVDITRGY